MVTSISKSTPSVYIILSLTTKTNQIRAEVDCLIAELDATGYQGLLHKTRRSAINMARRQTIIKNTLLFTLAHCPAVTIWDDRRICSDLAELFLRIN
ncbi:hypothetical protein KIN20_028333 [Parelaphostrongylus tenuis]|uniref:Uncharacterized protein n=1 Tax=Parelaphostrongylus tenuis TaxID=148309 RepID=A0AAD5R0M8_PARTN|nr:hypothetical protein KIN20_028333 [Parelaphostrongylus tenuis]